RIAVVARTDAIGTSGAPNHQPQRPDPATVSAIQPASRMRQTQDWHSCTRLIEDLGKYPLAEKVGLIFAACRMIRDIEPYLQNVRGWHPIAFHCRTEDCLWVFGNSDEDICFAAGRF